MRFLLSFLIAVGLVLLAVVSRASAAGRGAAELAPERFSSEVVQLVDAGWTLGGLDVDAEDETVTVAFTLVAPARERAVALSLELGEQGELPRAARRRRVAVPDEVRVYADTDELWRVLRSGPVTAIGMGCGGYSIVTAAGEAMADPDGWSVLRERVSGPAAGRELGRALAGPLAAGAHLSSVATVDGGVVFRLVGDDLPRTVRVALDGEGRVTGFEVHDSARWYGEGHLPREKKLARAVSQGAIERIVADADSVRFELVGGKRFAFRFDEMVYPESEGCGC